MNLKNQNILFFTRTMKLGGTENVILQLCEIFSHKVNKIVVCSCGGVNVGKLTQMGIKHYEIPDIENKNPKTMLKTLHKLKKIVEKEKISIIHTHHRMAAFYVALARLYRKCIFMNTSHNTFYDKRVLTRLAYKKANLVACGEMVKKNLVDFYGMLPESVEAITNSVNPFEGEIVEESYIRALHDDGKFVIGNVGRLSEQKGMEYYIKAIPMVLEKCPNTHFLIIGEGEDREKLETMVKEFKVNDAVTFMGYRTDIQNLMAQVDLIVLSSLWEGFPLTPIEAFSVGKTIVATAVDGTVEIVEDGKNGFLIEKASEEQIANKIVFLHKNRDILENMEGNASRAYIDKLSFEKFSEHYLNYYKEKIDERA